MLRKISKNQLIPISLSTLLTCTAIAWIGTTGINPSITLAKPVEINLPIYHQAQESYEQLLQRAENLAKTTINSRLKQDPSLNEIKVVIVGENQGAIAPLLMVKVSRQGWISAPQLKRWATYFTDSRLLLGFEQPGVTPEPTQAGAEQQSPNQSPTAENPAAQTPQEQQPQQIPLIEYPTQERQRNPLPVPTQRLRNAGNQLPFVDPVDVQQMRPDLSNQ